MKKILTLLIVLGIVISSTGCIYQHKNNTGETEYKSKNNITNDAEITKSGKTNNVQETNYFFYGAWKVTKCLALPPVSEFDNERIELYIGSEFIYKHDTAVSDDGTTLENPFYKVSSMSEYDFRDGYKVSLKDLGIHGDSVKKVEIWGNKASSKLWDRLGNTFFIYDKDTIILWDGAFFEMKRTE